MTTTFDELKRSVDEGEIADGAAWHLLAERVEHVLALHKSTDFGSGRGRCCEHCSDDYGSDYWQPWPCLTVRLLDGEDP